MFQRRVTERSGLGNAGSESFEASANSLRDCGLFSDVVITNYRHEVDYTTEAWLDQLPTHSDHAALQPEHLDRLQRAIGAEMDQMGGHMLVRYDTRLVSAYRQ